MLSKGFKGRLVTEGVSEDRVTVIPNWSLSLSDGESSGLDLRQKLGWTDHFVILFAGNMGDAQALTTVLDAAKLLESDDHVHFAFLGGGVALDSLKDRASMLGLTNVQFLPRVTTEEVGSYLQASDALLVHLKKDPLFSITIPSKIQAYLQAGRPILIGVEGDASDLVSEAGAGLIFEPENASDMAEKTRMLAELSVEEREAMSQNGARYYREELSLELGTQRFLALFRSLVE